MSIVQQLEKWAALLLGVYGWSSSRSVFTRFLAVMTVGFSLPMFIYSDSPQVAAGIFAVLLLFCLTVERGTGALHRTLSIAQTGLVIAAFVKITLLGVTAVYQHAGRSYASVARELRQNVPRDQPIAISQRAWLGLRGIVADPNLQFLTYSGPSLRQRPHVALDANADRYFATLVLESHILPSLRTVYPWIARGIDSGEYRLVKTIAPALAPLPWAKDPCYDLLVYRRDDAGTRTAAE